MGTPVSGPELDADGPDTPVASWVLLAIVNPARVMLKTYSSDAGE